MVLDAEVLVVDAACSGCQRGADGEKQIGGALVVMATGATKGISNVYVEI